MPENETLKRYLDAGIAFTQLTRERAEAIVKDLVKAGEVQRERTEEWIEELVERSRKNTEDLVSIVRREVASQLKALGIDDLAKRARPGRADKPGPSSLTDASPAPKSPPAKVPATAKGAPAAIAGDAPANKKKKAAAKKAPASAAKKSTGAKKSSSTQPKKQAGG